MHQDLLRKAGIWLSSSVTGQHKTTCPHCSHHFAIGHERYVKLLADSDSFIEMDAGVSTADPLGFRDTRRYSERIREARKNSRMNEAVHTGVCTVGGNPVALVVMDSRFILGTMGSATGEKIPILLQGCAKRGFRPVP